MADNSLPEGVLKATPESFIVQEIIKSNPPRAVSFYDESIIRGWDGESPVTVFGLSKRGWSAEDAMKEVARQLGVSFSDISAHGLKDKYARTSQHIGVWGNFRPTFSHPDISLVQLYGQQFPLRRGDIVGNRFDIFILSTADQLDLAPGNKWKEPVPNLFGIQRLGQEGSEQVGRFFLEGEPDKAVELLLTTPGAETFLRAEQLAGGSWAEALAHHSFQFSFKFEIQKWQSYLWNKLLQEKKKSVNNLPDRLPMWNPSKTVSEMYKHLWNPPRLNPEVLKFITEQYRPTMLWPNDFYAKRKTTGWNFKFDLPPGAYATTVLAQLFKLKERHIVRG